MGSGRCRVHAERIDVSCDHLEVPFDLALGTHLALERRVGRQQLAHAVVAREVSSALSVEWVLQVGRVVHPRALMPTYWVGDHVVGLRREPLVRRHGRDPHGNKDERSHVRRSFGIPN